MMSGKMPQPDLSARELADLLVDEIVDPAWRVRPDWPRVRAQMVREAVAMVEAAERDLLRRGAA